VRPRARRDASQAGALSVRGACRSDRPRGAGAKRQKTTLLLKTSGPVHRRAARPSWRHRSRDSKAFLNASRERCTRRLRTFLARHGDDLMESSRLRPGGGVGARCMDSPGALFTAGCCGSQMELWATAEPCFEKRLQLTPLRGPWARSLSRRPSSGRLLIFRPGTEQQEQVARQAPIGWKQELVKAGSPLGLAAAADRLSEGGMCRRCCNGWRHGARAMPRWA